MSLKFYSVILSFILSSPALATIYLPYKIQGYMKDEPRRVDRNKPGAQNLNHRYLLKLKGPSLFEQMRLQKQANPIWTKEQLQKLQQQKIALKQKLSSTFKQKPLKFHYDYNLVWNGMAIELEVDDLNLLNKFSEIEHAVPVQEFTIPVENFKQAVADTPPDEMLPPLNIPEIWQQHNLSGKGAIIAVFDTGIDYTHADLGGCFGEKCRVVGGYDFINNDADPMDDHGHGTHVAGIAAGNGRKKGAAPQATLFAYKVLSKYGSGATDGIIAALEKAIDPNGDGVYDDIPHIANFSLGAGPTNLYSPLKEAINEFGRSVLVVAAAGNNGQWGPGIGAPGSAEMALTVGASKDETTRIPFSSIGPSEHYAMKPDLLAPGVDIWSTFLNGEYKKLSGTSMATPLTSGIAALLVEKMSLKRAARIKTHLMNTAKPLSAPIDFISAQLKEGRGLIQPKAAADVSISFGTQISGFPDEQNLFLAHEETFSRVSILSLYQYASGITEYKISTLHNLGDNIEVKVSTDHVVVDPKVSRYFTVYATIKGKTADIPSDYDRGIQVFVENLTTGEKYTAILPVFLRARYDLTIEKPGDFLSVNLFPNVESNFLWRDPDSGNIHGLTYIKSGPENFLGEQVTDFPLVSRIPYVENLRAFYHRGSVNKGIQRRITPASYTHETSLRLYDSHGFLLEGIRDEWQFGNWSVSSTGTYASVQFNDMTQFGEAAPLGAAYHIGQERAHYAGARYNFAQPSKTLNLPTHGYEYYDARRTDYSPAMICHFVFMGYPYRFYWGSVAGISLVDQIYIGKGPEFASLGWMLDYYENFSEDYCAGTPTHEYEVTGNLEREEAKKL